MKFAALILMVFFLPLTACDRFYGPKIINEVGLGVKFVVEYADGGVVDMYPDYCVGTFIGNPGRLINKIKVVDDGQVVLEVDEQRIGWMMEIEDEVSGNAMWGFTGDGLVFRRKVSRICERYLNVNNQGN